MQVEQYYSDDYAGLVSGNLSFYYGYEVTDENSDDWCFQVKKNGKEIFKVTTTEIEKALQKPFMQLDNPTDYLIAGIGMWLLLK